MTMTQRTLLVRCMSIVTVLITLDGPARAGSFSATADGSPAGGAVVDEKRGVQHIFLCSGHSGGPAGLFRLGRSLDAPKLAAYLQAREHSDCEDAVQCDGKTKSTKVNAPGEWKSLFNGRDLDGWHRQKKRGLHGAGGNWGITQDGVLFGEQDPPGSGNGGLLLSDDVFPEFELELSLRPDWGPDSGVFVRTDETGGGWQIYVDHHDNGNVGHVRLETRPYSVPFRPFGFSRIDPQQPTLKMVDDSRTKNWPEGVYEQTCTKAEWLAVWKADNWNRLRIRVTGGHLPVIEVWVNQLAVCRFDASKTTHPQFDPKRARSVVLPAGSIGFQVHGGKNWQAGQRVFWKDVRLRRLK